METVDEGFRSRERIGPAGAFSLMSRHLLITAAVAFFVVKVFFIVAPTTAAGMPRLGDDALAHLWYGVTIGLEDNGESLPAVSDIRRLGSLQDAPSSRAKWWRDRVGSRVNSPTGEYLLYRWMTHGVLALGLGTKWSWAVLELIVALTMTLGFAYFLSALVGPQAAGIGMIFLTFAIVPGFQGMHQFIPSTFALSLSLLLWGYVIKAKSSAGIVPALGLAVAILGMHPVGNLYVAVAVALYGLQFSGRRRLIFFGYAILTAAIAIVLWGILVAMRQPGGFADLDFVALITGLFWYLGGLDFGSGLLANLGGAWKWLSQFAVALPVMIIAAIVGAIWLRRTLLDRALVITFGVLAATMVASLSFYFPDNPGDLFSRLLVAFAVFLAGLAGGLVFHLWQSGLPVRRVLAAALLVGSVLYSVPIWWGSIFVYLNGKLEIVTDEPLRTQLDALPVDTSLVYMDTDIGPVSSLIQGGGRFGAIPYLGLANTSSFAGVFEKRRPTLAVVPLFPQLNTLAAAGDKSFVRRRHGFYLGKVDRVAVAAKTGESLSDLHVYIVSDGPEFTIAVMQIETPTAKAYVTVPGKFKGWLRLWDPRFDRARGVYLELPEVAAWIEGVATGSPVAGVRWPWDSGAYVGYHRRGDRASDNRFTGFVFSVEHLLKLRPYGRDVLAFISPAKARVISDDSGLVFITTKYTDGSGS